MISVILVPLWLCVCAALLLASFVAATNNQKWWTSFWFCVWLVALYIPLILWG